MPASLSDRWGSKDIWLRALFVKSNLIWLFRDEFPKLLLGELRWLDAILSDAYLVAGVQAARFDTDEQAFATSIELVKNNIEQRIATFGSDAELQRLKTLVDNADTCNPFQEIFKKLDKKTKRVYGPKYCRMVSLESEWLIDHPLRSFRPREYPDPYHVTAQTRVDEDEARATIKLKIHLDEFEVLSLLAVPALLTHELICHAHAREEGYDSRSIWAEGVMDWTALFFFEKWSWCLGLPYGNTDEHGKILWGRRINPSRVTGRSAAADLTQWLATEESVRTITVARGVTARLAVDVNVFQAPLLKKDLLATRFANVRQDKTLQEGIRAWRNNGGGTAAVADLLG
jgi:hypothetical protein